MAGRDRPVPILVGCGQVTQREPDPARARSPIELTAAASRLAAEDSGAGAAVWGVLDTVVVVRSFADTSWRFACPFGRYVHPPRSLATRLGASNARRLVYTSQGGNMPQWCVNRLFGMVTRGEVGTALIAGGEALATQKAAERAGLALDWNEDPGGAPEIWGNTARGWSDLEDRHGMRGAIFAYPLFENAIRGAMKLGIAEHANGMGNLFARFAAVAAHNPLADRRQGFTAEQIATVGPANPYIGFPYTKLMNANAFIDQSAALLVTSTKMARTLGIPEEKWVYLHGCADANDHWFISDRQTFHGSPAIRAVTTETFAMAGRTAADVDHLDIYSCFPSAVEVACHEMGIALDDPRKLTVTGGLAYFGGPGNNYVTHSIAEMMNRVRTSRGSFGLVTANGNYLTKHSAGIYTTVPPGCPFAPTPPPSYQAAIDAVQGPRVIENAEGEAAVETYTVMHDRAGPTSAIVFGRLADGSRLIANTPTDAKLLKEMTEIDFLGAKGTVRPSGNRNIFTPA